MKSEIRQMFLDGETLNARAVVTTVGCSEPLFFTTMRNMRAEGHRFEEWWDPTEQRNQYKLKPRPPVEPPTLEERVQRLERIVEYHRLMGLGLVV